jgi:hypothetical protein
MLLQLFALTVLGGWVGLRSYVYSQATNVEKAIYKWGKREWVVNGASSQDWVCLERKYADPAANWKRESQMLREAVNEPWLEELRLWHLNTADDLEFSALAEAKHLSVLKLHYATTTIPPEDHIETIARVSSLRSLFIQGGDFTRSDITKLQKHTSLNKLQLHGCTFDQALLRETVRMLRLEHLEVHPYREWNPLPGVAYWQGYYALHRSRKQIDADDLAWVSPAQIRILQIDGSSLTLEAAQQIGELPNLDSLTLHCRVEGSALSEIAKATKVRNIFMVQIEQPLDRASFDLAVNDLLLMPKLKCIHCDWGVFKPELDYPKPTEEERRLESMGQPPPPQFNRPPTPEQSAFVARVNEQRKERGLGELKINPTDKERQQLLTE